MKKNHIEKAWIERQLDEQADTSFIGKYTDKKSDWVICRHCGEFVAIAEQPNRRAEEIDDEIVELENEENYDDTVNNSEKINLLKKELAGLELHDCPHTSREFNYFKPYVGEEPEGSENYQKYGKQDFDRMESLNNGNWNFIGIIVKAEILTSNGTIQVVRSGGLWGIESDSGTYLDEVGKDELENLRLELSALGFGKRAIDHAFQNVETKDK
jgi:hypothetical protein